jgi:two-component system cell cycle response regulator
MSDLEFINTPYEEAYRKLHHAFLERLRNSIEAIDNILAQKNFGPLKKPDLERAMHLSHGLAGSGTTFGFPDVTTGGQRIDQFLNKVIKALPPDEHVSEDDFATLQDMLLQLREKCRTALSMADAEPLAPFKNPAAGLSEGKTSFSVLVVDDDKNLLDLMTLKLQQKNIRVVGVTDSGAAIAMMTRQLPDLIVLDINMPGLNGHDILRRLKQDPEFVAIPVLMLTAQAQEKDVVSALHSGAMDYIVKPFDADQLVARVEKILDASRFTVVIADNDPLILQLLDRKFRNRGFRVRLAEDGTDAWRQIFKTLPDLVILDRMMPGIEGFAILKQMREEKSTANIPVIILSARKQERDIAEGLKRGAQDYLVKPFILDDLIARSLKLLMDKGRQLDA